VARFVAKTAALFLLRLKQKILKRALALMKIKPVRGAAQHYKKGGKAEGGSLSKRMTAAKSEAEKQAESMRDVGKMVQPITRKSRRAR